ncbi:MAG: type 4a pilus biogenesis protein PilO [Candidatus Woesebacteria bacterium]
MPIQRPSLQRTIIQMDLNRFYDKPVTRVSVALVLSLLAIAFFALAAIRPTLQTMAELLKEIDQKKTLDEKLTQKITALTSAQRQLSEKEALFPVLSIAIPSNPNFAQLMTVIEKLATERQVEFSSAQIQKVPLEGKPPSATAKYQLVSYPMTLAFSGSYENLILLMRDLQSIKRIIAIDRFDISPAVQSAPTELTLTLAIRAFSFNQLQGAAPAPVPVP